MNKSASKIVNIFLALDKNAIKGYFNPHDNSPIYKRQLSLKFEQYLGQAVKSCKRYDPIFFKLNSTNKVDEQYADPLVYAIRRHFSTRKEEETRAFKRFKKRNYGVITASVVLVALFNLLLPLAMSKDMAKESGISHFIDVFGFVIVYHPLTELLFNWNPFLKRIHLYNKLIKAEIFIVNGEKNTDSFESFEEYDYSEETDQYL